MTVFKPAEIRAILLLSVLVLIGSMLTLLKRQGKLADLDLQIFLDNERYKYTYEITADQTPEIEAGQTGNNEDENVPAEETSVTGPLDLNTAGYYDLLELPGIGPVLAGRIIAYRDSVGEFDSVNQLLQVSGIGEVKFRKLKNELTVE